MDILELPKTVGATLMIVLALILVDFLFGVFISIRDGIFDFKKLPQFVITSILPYIGGLLILAIVAQYIGAIFLELFLSISALVVVKYIVNLKDKIFVLFGVKKQE